MPVLPSPFRRLTSQVLFLSALGVLARNASHAKAQRAQREHWDADERNGAALLRPPQLEITICDFKSPHSSSVTRNMKSSGNLSRLRLTAWTSSCGQAVLNMTMYSCSSSSATASSLWVSRIGSNVEKPATCRFQWGEFVPHHIPHDGQVDTEIFVNEDVA